ncbi:MAG: TetR/AcrR family transcriptional regulator [Pirellulales bacterium]|nr:TetR/AcrR family transcriptional regulator [Pirellulales bacterium]
MAEAKLDTEIRREQIAEAAMNLIAAQGMRKMSIAAVARRVGLVPSGIYRHFKNKDEIIHAVLDRVAERLSENVRAACCESDEPLEQLKGVLMRHIRFIREGRAVPRMIFADDARTDGARLKRHVVEVFSGYVARVADIVARGQQQGVIRGDVPVQTIAMMLFGVVIPAGIMWHMTDGGFDVTRHAEKSWRLFVAAVANNANNHV